MRLLWKIKKSILSRKEFCILNKYIHFLSRKFFIIKCTSGSFIFVGQYALFLRDKKVKHLEISRKENRRKFFLLEC